MMSGIRGKDTKLEIIIRKALHRRGFRYRLHVKDIPGRPDMWLPRHRAVVFIHGCFWHGHDCSLFRLPETRQDFWKSKVAGNRARDARQSETLLEAGYRVITIWECAIRGTNRIGLDAAIDLAAKWIEGESNSFEIRGGNGVG
mgnify:CR=1 FL=1|jgi:DNA mismatch endonuclease (patch repair protein)